MSQNYVRMINAGAWDLKEFRFGYCHAKIFLCQPGELFKPSINTWLSLAFSRASLISAPG